MIKIKKKLPFMLIIVSMYSLITISNVFFSYQNTIIVESNGLLGENYISLTDLEKVEQIEKELQNESYWKLMNIERNIFLFYSNDYENVTIPLNSGKFFSKENTQEAIVGSNVDTYFSKEKEWIDYNEKTYQVVGKVGIVSKGAIEDYIIFNDESDFTNLTEFYFDSNEETVMNEIKEKYQLSTENKGVGRWLDIQSYLLIIKILSVGITFLLAITLGFLFSNMNYKVNILKIELGVNEIKSIVIDTIILFFLNVVFSFITISIFNVTTKNLISGDISLQLAAVVFIQLLVNLVQSMKLFKGDKRIK